MNGFTQSSYPALFSRPSDEDYKTLIWIFGAKLQILLDIRKKSLQIFNKNFHFSSARIPMHYLHIPDGQATCTLIGTNKL